MSVFLLKLTWHGCIYHIWCAKNDVLHNQETPPIDQVLRVVSFAVRHSIEDHKRLRLRVFYPGVLARPRSPKFGSRQSKVAMQF